MRYFTYAEWPYYPLVFLVPSIRSREIKKEYLDPFGIPPDDVMCLQLHTSGKRTPVKEMKAFLEEELIPFLQEEKEVQYLVVADAGYFRQLTGLNSAEPYLGYVVDCRHGPWKVLYVPNYRTVFYDPPKTRARIAQGMEALLAHAQGTYSDPGDGVIHFEEYPETDEEIQAWLNKLLEMDCDLTVDIEAFSLKHHESGIGTISFAWSKHEGIAFPVDYVPVYGPRVAPDGTPYSYGKQERNETRRKMLREFFTKFVSKSIYHNIGFDGYVLIYQLFMNDFLDTEGLLKGMEIILRNWDDTQLITYLATNSCAGNELGLKPNSQEFSGNYSVDEIKDITKIPLQELLRYNLVDTLSTWYVHEKYWDKMVKDDQLDIYQKIFQPAMWEVIQMQLTGMPLNQKKVSKVRMWLEAIIRNAEEKLFQSDIIQQYIHQLREQHVYSRNQKLKRKKITLRCKETQAITFNPGSSKQKQELLFEMLGLPIIERTKTKQPATGGEVLEKLQNHTDDPRVKQCLQALIDHAAVSKLLSAFIPAFEEAPQASDGWHYLFGSYKLGGAVSGRMSSSNPNMQNLPSNVTMLLAPEVLEQYPTLKNFTHKGRLHLGNLIKWCFEAPPGWVLVGLDFDSLEDRISALTTKDPNKMRVYTDGYDGHSLRAYAYFGHLMEGIDPKSVESINSIKERYPKLRQDSKTPTFALSYQGTWHTLVKDAGFSEEEAKRLEQSYDDLYVVSNKWVQDHLDRASKVGYVTVAFGLRVRTPLLAQVVRGSRKTPHEAQSEGRTAGNALGQSWCMLNNRAGSEFMQKVRQSEYRLDIRPTAAIHDSQYFLIRDSVDTLLFVNTHLVKAVQWQEHPDIYHPVVKLGGNLSIFWPDWSNEIEIPNNCDEEILIRILQSHLV